MQRLAQRWRLFGNSAETVAKVKNPELLATICAGLGIPCPELSLSQPPSPADWLVKRKGGAGGGHIKPALQRAQRRRRNVLSAQNVGNADWGAVSRRRRARRRARIQRAMVFADTASAVPVWRRGTAGDARAGCRRSARRRRSTDLQRLFRWSGSTARTFWSTAKASGCWRSIRGRARRWISSSRRADRCSRCTWLPARASCLLHRTIRKAQKRPRLFMPKMILLRVPALDWPEWSADRPVAGSTIKAGEPVCTVYAYSPAAAAARAIVDQRREMILAWTRAGGNHEGPAPDQRE